MLLILLIHGYSFLEFDNSCWRVLIENVLLQHFPGVGVRYCAIGGLGWVRKVCSKRDEAVAKSFLKEGNVGLDSVAGCAILLEPL